MYATHRSCMSLANKNDYENNLATLTRKKISYGYESIYLSTMQIPYEYILSLFYVWVTEVNFCYNSASLESLEIARDVCIQFLADICTGQQNRDTAQCCMVNLETEDHTTCHRYLQNVVDKWGQSDLCSLFANRQTIRTQYGRLEWPKAGSEGLFFHTSEKLAWFRVVARRPSISSL